MAAGAFPDGDTGCELNRNQATEHRRRGAPDQVSSGVPDSGCDRGGAVRGPERGHADAAPGSAPTIDVIGACPDDAAVRRVLTELVPPDAANAAPVRVEDHGAHVRVAVREAATTLDDPARDCAARARMAAAFAATELLAQRIVLRTAGVDDGEGHHLRGRAVAGGRGVGARRRVSGRVRPRRWSLFGSAGARGPATLMLDHGWEAELLRFPLDGGARITARWGRFRAWLNLAASLTITGIMGSELVQTEREWRADLGALVMGGATLRVTDRLGLSAALDGPMAAAPLPAAGHPRGNGGRDTGVVVRPGARLHDRREAEQPAVKSRSWFALALALAAALAAARCDKDVVLGVDPGSDAAGLDAGDAGAAD